MADIVEQVKGANRIEDVIEETGFPLDRKRGRYIHGKEHDSLVIDTVEGAYFWNSQNEQGDVIAWLEKRKHWDFKTAVEWLAQRAKLPRPEWGGENNEQRLAARAREDALTVAARVFVKRLRGNPAATGYCEGRGWDAETVRAAGLGFTGSGSPEEAKDLQGELNMNGVELTSPAAKAALGLPSGMLVYPHVRGGRVRYLSLRSIEGKRHYNLPVELAGPRQAYFNHVYGGTEELCVLVEGQADAVTLGQWGIPAVALAGTAFKDHQGLIKELRERHPKLYVGLDADEGGRKALMGNEGKWELAFGVGALSRVIDWRDGAPGKHAALAVEGEEKEIKDANDLLKIWGEIAVDEQKRKIGDLLAAAPTVVEAAARWAGKLKGAERDEGQRTAFKLIACMGRVERAQYRSRLADLLGIGLREFNEIVKETAKDEGEDGKEKLEIVETLGGWISDSAFQHVSADKRRGWLIEYVYDPVEEQGRLAYRDPDRKTGVAEHLDIDGVRYVPKGVTGFIKNEGVLFASDLGPLKPTRELVGIVEAFIHQHYLLESKYLGKIIAYYVLLTWVYDCFNALPYLRAMGEPGAGKSELMRRIGYLCYRLLPASGANTAASFFRATETFKGTVFIDEADLHDGGDMSNDLVKFLNLGAMKGNPIWRLEEVISEGGKSYEVATFSTYGPKLIAMRKDFRDDAVGSRSLTIKLMPREPVELRERGIRLYIDNEFREKARAIRNLLLRWRMEVWQPQIEVGEELMDLEISSRLNQVTMPLKALAQGDEGLMAEIESFLRAYNQELTLTRSMTIAARVVEAMWKIYRYPDLRLKLMKVVEGGEEYMMIGDVRTIANEIIDEMNAEPDEDQGESEDKKGRRRKKDELSARGVGHVIRNELQLQVGQRRGSGFPVYWDRLKMEGLAKRYGVDWEHIGSNGKV